MHHEKDFFERLAATALPGWDIKLQPHLQPGQMDLASYDVHIYVVDTSTGWTAAGAMQTSGFSAAARLPAETGLTLENVTDMATKSITELGREQPAADAPAVVQCIQLTAAALTGTQTFDQVRASADLSGHWVYVAYRMHYASTISRPVFFRTKAPWFLPVEGLYQGVRHIVAQDGRSSSSTVGRMLKRAGGPILDARFSSH